MRENSVYYIYLITIYTYILSILALCLEWKRWYGGSMQIIAVVESDDYGPAAIVDPEQISIMRFDDLYLAATRCVFTNMAITSEISEETANELMKKGVRCLSMSSDKTVVENEKE
jgi:hypothetical protein